MQPPIKDYALIGDCHGAALISRDGSVDWCTLLRFDRDPDFFRLLDAGGGGFWDVQVQDLRHVSRAYAARTNILETRFESGTGILLITDFMPVGRSRTASTHDYVSLNAPGWLVRRFTCIEGTVDFTTRFRPSGPEFSLAPLKMRRAEGHVECTGGLSLFHGATSKSEKRARLFTTLCAKGKNKVAR
jgi:GH15 family glucan-1,4-alpha-glucosidase